MFEKREHGRSPIELAASYGIGEDPRPRQETEINNVSMGGFCLTMDRKLAIGEKIQLSIDLDSDKDAIILAKVVWMKKDDNNRHIAGVQIIEKAGQDYDRFLEFYNSQL